MVKFTTRANLLISFGKFLRNTQSTEAIFDVADALCRIGAVGWATRRFEPTGEAGDVIRNRKMMGRIDLDQLLLCPPNSLGRVFAQHMKELGLDPEFFRTVDIKTDDEYMMMRMRQTHDLWHVVTGFQTDFEGELAIQALMLSYVHLPLPALLIGGGLVKSVFAGGENTAGVAKAINSGVALGLRVRGLFAYDWEANWSKPLLEIRRELGIIPMAELVPTRCVESVLLSL